MQAIELRTGVNISLSSLLELYTSVGWAAYTSDANREDLGKAISNSSFVVSTWGDDRSVGLARVLSDDVSICHIQDLLVHPDCQRQGIGGRLLQACLARYAHVRSKVLLTDDEQWQHAFYEKMGFRNTHDVTSAKLNTFVQIDGVD